MDDNSNINQQEHDYALELLDSMRIIADAQIEKTKQFDQTIVCTVVDDSEAEQGRYKVSNGSATFVAYGDTKYHNNNSVLVTIPLGDYDQQKIIIGRYTSSESDIYNYVKPFAHLIDVTGNINLKNDTNSSSFGLYANGGILGSPYNSAADHIDFGGPKHAGYWSALEQQSNDNYLNPLLGYEILGIKADFNTYLREYNCIKGNYGLKVYVFSYNPEDESIDNLRTEYNSVGVSNLTTVSERINALNRIGQSHKLMCNIFDFNTSDMNGDVYDFDIGYEQEAIFNIEKLNTIVHIEVLFYQDNDFQYRDEYAVDNPATLQDESIKSIDYKDIDLDMVILPSPNLVVQNIYFCLGYNQESFDTDKLILYTENDLFYSRHNNNISNTKTLNVKWIHKFDNGLIGIYDSRTLPNGYRLEWYKYVLNKQPETKYSGIHWEKQVEHDGQWSYTFIPDIGLVQEQIKVILVPVTQDIYGNEIEDINHTITSNIVTFRNSDPAISEQEQEILDLTGFYLQNKKYPVDNCNYFLYDNTNRIVSIQGTTLEQSQTTLNPAEEIRTIRCMFDQSPLYKNNVEYIKWSFPKKDSMIIPLMTSNLPSSESTGYRVICSESEISVDYYLVDLRNKISYNEEEISIDYKIRDIYTNYYTNNIIKCEIVMERVKYTAAITMNFGYNSSNGSDYTLVPHFISEDENDGTRTPIGLEINPSKDTSATIQLDIYNQEGQKLDWNNDSIFGDVKVIWQEYYHTPYQEAGWVTKYQLIENDNIPEYRKTGNNINKNTSGNYYSPIYYELNQDSTNALSGRYKFDTTYQLLGLTADSYDSSKTYYLNKAYKFKRYTNYGAGTVVYLKVEVPNIQDIYKANMFWYSPSSENADELILATETTYKKSRIYYTLIKLPAYDPYDTTSGTISVPTTATINDREYYYSESYPTDGTIIDNPNNRWIEDTDTNFHEDYHYFIKKQINLIQDNSGTYYLHEIPESGTNGKYNSSKNYVTKTVKIDTTNTHRAIEIAPIGIHNSQCFLMWSKASSNDANVYMNELLALKVIVRNLLPYDLETYFPVPLYNGSKQSIQNYVYYIHREQPTSLSGIVSNQVYYAKKIYLYDKSQGVNTDIDYYVINQSSETYAPYSFYTKISNQVYELSTAQTVSSDTKYYSIKRVNINEFEDGVDYFSTSDDSFVDLMASGPTNQQRLTLCGLYDIFYTKITSPYYAYLPLGYSGPTLVRYDTMGYVESYKNPIYLEIVSNTNVWDIPTDVFIPARTFLLNPSNNRPKEWKSYSNGRDYGTIDKKGVYHPTTIFLDENEVHPYGIQVTGTMNNNAVTWFTQPIVCYQNNYPNGTINKWSGDGLVIDEGAGIVIGHAIHAGKKNDDNTFSGVMLGDLSVDQNIEPSIGSQTGVYGFHHGAVSYAFKEDGTAFIGKAGHGRINFDGNKGVIRSETWTETQKNGMYIDLDDGYILMHHPAGSVTSEYTAITIRNATTFNRYNTSPYTLYYYSDNLYHQVQPGDTYNSELDYYYTTTQSYSAGYINLDSRASEAYPLAIGTNERAASRKFRVTWSGQLYATDAVLSGTITASNGIIGGWYIESDNLHNINWEYGGSRTGQVLLSSSNSSNDNGIKLKNTTIAITSSSNNHLMLIGAYSNGTYGISHNLHQTTVSYFGLGDIYHGLTFDNLNATLEYQHSNGAYAKVIVGGFEDMGGQQGLLSLASDGVLNIATYEGVGIHFKTYSSLWICSDSDLTKPDILTITHDSITLNIDADNQHGIYARFA